MELESPTLTSTLEKLCKRMSTRESSTTVPTKGVLTRLGIIRVFAGVETAFEIWKGRHTMRPSGGHKFEESTYQV